MKPTNIDLDQLLDQLLIARGEHPTIVRCRLLTEERKLAKDLVALVNNQTASEPEQIFTIDVNEDELKSDKQHNNFFFKIAIKGDGTPEYGQKIIDYFKSRGTDILYHNGCMDEYYYEEYYRSTSIKWLKTSKEIPEGYSEIYLNEPEITYLFKPAFKGDGTKEYGQKIIEAFNAIGVQNNGLTCSAENLYYFAKNNQIELSTILPTDHTLKNL